jgi:hypothetical protein
MTGTMKILILATLIFSSVPSHAQTSCLKINEVLVEIISQQTTPCLKAAPRLSAYVYSGSWSFKLRTKAKYVREYFNRCSGQLLRTETFTKLALFEGATYSADDRSLQAAISQMIQAKQQCLSHRAEKQQELDLLKP